MTGVSPFITIITSPSSSLHLPTPQPQCCAEELDVEEEVEEGDHNPPTNLVKLNPPNNHSFPCRPTWEYVTLPGVEVRFPAMLLERVRVFDAEGEDEVGVRPVVEEEDVVRMWSFGGVGWGWGCDCCWFWSWVEVVVWEGERERERRRKRENREGSGLGLGSVVVVFVRGGEGRGRVEDVVVRE